MHTPCTERGRLTICFVWLCSATKDPRFKLAASCLRSAQASEPPAGALAISLTDIPGQPQFVMTDSDGRGMFFVPREYSDVATASPTPAAFDT
jgi:hypothetical protein